MKNKKTILIILLAAILAFIAAFLIFVFLNKKPEKPVQNSAPSQQETIVEEPAAEEALQKTEEKQEEVAKEQPKPASTQKVTQPPKQAVKATPKKAAAPKPDKETLKPAVQKVELPQAAEVQKAEEAGVVIPVEYTTKNTYKYVYTPAKYSEK